MYFYFLGSWKDPSGPASMEFFLPSILDFLSTKGFNLHTFKRLPIQTGEVPGEGRDWPRDSNQALNGQWHISSRTHHRVSKNIKESQTYIQPRARTYFLNALYFAPGGWKLLLEIPKLWNPCWKRIHWARERKRRLSLRMGDSISVHCP